MKKKEEVKEMSFEELELYYFLQKAFNELLKFVDIIRGRNKKKTNELHGKYYTLPYAERKVVDGVVNRAKKANHHLDVYAGIRVVEDTLTAE